MTELESETYPRCPVCGRPAAFSDIPCSDCPEPASTLPGEGELPPPIKERSGLSFECALSASEIVRWAGEMERSAAAMRPLDKAVAEGNDALARDLRQAAARLSAASDHLARRPLASPPPGVASTLPGDGERAWFVERSGKWLTVRFTDWEVQQALDPELWRQNWTRDPNAALRFARRDDAEAMIRKEGLQNAEATEHVWIAASPPPGVVSLPRVLHMPNGDVLTRQHDSKYWTTMSASGAVATNETDDELAEQYGLEALFLAALAPTLPGEDRTGLGWQRRAEIAESQLQKLGEHLVALETKAAVALPDPSDALLKHAERLAAFWDASAAMLQKPGDTWATDNAKTIRHLINFARRQPVLSIDFQALLKKYMSAVEYAENAFLVDRPEKFGMTDEEFAYLRNLYEEVRV